MGHAAELPRRVMREPGSQGTKHRAYDHLPWTVDKGDPISIMSKAVERTNAPSIGQRERYTK